ncbi:RER1A-like protein [Tanacetum coccineum]
MMTDGTTTDPKQSISDYTFKLTQRYQHFLDKSTPHILHRWISFAVIFFIYALRVYFVQGFYIVTYGLGIYILQLFLAFLSPQVDPELQDDGLSLPTRGSEEFRPFVRRLPEFKFLWREWKSPASFFMVSQHLRDKRYDFRYSLTRAFCIAFMLTFFSMFDVPVFWPILLFYWLKYTGKKAAVDDAASGRP